MKKSEIGFVGKFGRKWFWVSFAILIVVGICVYFLANSAQVIGKNRNENEKLQIREEILAAVGKLPMTFEINQGQTNEAVLFLSRGTNYNLYLTANKAILSLYKKDNEATATFEMALANSNPAPKIGGVGDLEGKVNYIFGKQSKDWKTDVSTFAKVKYAEVYKGIDLIYYGKQSELEYDFVVAPNANPDEIRMIFGGAEAVSIDEQTGDLILQTARGEIRQHAPIIYQEIGGVRKTVQGCYKIFETQEIGFEIGDYDQNETLVIDPILIYSTYLGGSDAFSTANDGTVSRGDIGYSVAVDENGFTYIAGAAHSTDFPLANAVQTQCSTTLPNNPNFGCIDAFVTKFDQTRNELIYSTYLGGFRTADGLGIDIAKSIAAETSGNAYITGFTNSPDYPTTAGAFQRFFPCLAGGNAGGCSFVTKLSATGTIVYSTFLGGNASSGINYEGATGIAVDSGGSAYVVGNTQISSFPVLNGFRTKCFVPRPGNPDTYCDGSWGFLTKLKADGSDLLYSTFIGGEPKFGGAISPIVEANDVAVDNQGNAYIIGGTNKNFPVRRALPGQGTFQSNTANCTLYYTQCFDAFVMKINTNAIGAASLGFSTFLGGDSFDLATGVAIDTEKNIYVTGYTNSNNFPITPNASDNSCGNMLSCTASEIERRDTFITKIKANLSGFSYSTFVGGDAGEVAGKIAVDSSGNAFITGSTNSTDFPTTANALQQTLNGAQSAAYFAKFSSGGDRDYSTYLRGTQNNEANSFTLGNDIFVDAGGNAHLTGGTTSHEFPTTNNAVQFVNRSQNNVPFSVFGYNAFYAVIGDPTPVVFIPGVSGSVLKDSSAGNLERWVGIDLSNDHRFLTLNPASPFFRGNSIFAADALRAVLPTTPALRADFYDPLIKSLKFRGGYVEYDVNDDPNRRTLGGCDVVNQQSKGPSLFILAYDWRKDNAEIANQRLADYVQCIEQFYGANTKINIVAHSMGNYIARRYILDHPNKVNKHISIGAPWLGGPKIINVLATGQFFDTFGEKVAVAGDDTFKFLVEDFTAAHQILPSRSFFALGGRPYYEKDANGNFKIYNSYEDFIARMNELYPRTRPGDAGRLFHDYPGQDDWRNDTSGVQYYHILGLRSKEDTVGTVIKEPTKEVCIQIGSTTVCRDATTYKLLKVMGDGTVPRLSAERKRNGINLNSPNARVVPFVSLSEDTDKLVEHTGLTQNPSVQKAVLQFLGEPVQTNSPLSSEFGGETAESFAVPPVPLLPTYGINFAGLNAVKVADDFGNTTEPLPNAAGFITTVPGVDYQKPGLDFIALTLPTGQNFTITFTMPNQPIMIEWTKGTKKLMTAAGRYLDLNLPQNTNVRLTITTNGVQDLRYDADNNGTFETIINPTAQTSGANANDKDAPLISFDETMQGGMSNLALSAIDGGSGVSSLMYSTNGTNYQPYTTPLTLNASQTVYAFSDDNNGNRSSTVSYQTGSFKVKVNGNIADGNNNGVSDVVLNLTDSNNATLTTQTVGGGIYLLAGLTAGNSYTLAPEHPFYTFTPQSVQLNNLSQSATVNFTATRKVFNISGRVTDQNNNGVAGVLLTLNNGQTTNTDSNGNYTFSILEAGEDYIITASKPFFEFDQTALQILELDANETVNFKGFQRRFGISGRITNTDDNGFARVSVTVSGNGQTFTTQTDDSGFYFFDELAGGENYTVTPSKAGADFVPQNLAFNNLSNEANGNFTSPTSPNTWTGEISSDWFDGTNWVGGAVPPETANVFIPSGALNEIFIGSDNVVVAGLNLESGRTLTIGVGKTLTVQNNAIINGNLNGEGIFNCNDTATFSGTEVQSIPQSILNNLTLNNSAGLTLSGNVNIGGTLNLTNGIIKTNEFVLTLDNAAISQRTSGFVIGNLQKNFAGNADLSKNAQRNLSFVFHVGTNSDGADYSPVEANITSVSGSSGYLTVKAFDTVSPAPISSAKISRYWDLDGANIVADLSFSYLDEDDDGINNPANLRIFRNAQNVCLNDCVDETARTANISNVSQFSPWTIAELAPTAANVSISGRVFNPNGQAIRNATVEMIDANGAILSVKTNAFGYFHFETVEVGQTYIFNVKHKIYRFNPQVVTVSDELQNLEFTGVLIE